MPGEIVRVDLERRGRPASKLARDTDSGEYAHPAGAAGSLMQAAIYFRDFDGGDIPAPDEFNDYLDLPFSGGGI